MTAYIFHHGAKEKTNFYSKLNVLEFLDVDNLHEKFGSNTSKIVDFFLLSIFSGHFSVFDFIEKLENHHHKLDNRKKSAVLEIPLQNFLCKSSIFKNSGKLNLK